MKWGGTGGGGRGFAYALDRETLKSPKMSGMLSKNRDLSLLAPGTGRCYGILESSWTVEDRWSYIRVFLLSG